jgi:hypothetical protein
VTPRIALVAVALLAVAFGAPAATSKPAQNPPSSLRPTHPPAKLRLSHEHRRVVECEATRARSEGEISCKASTEPLRAGTSITLQPVDVEGRIIAADERQAVTVELPNEIGPVEVARDVAAGAWEIAWAGTSAPGRFGVAHGEELRLRFETTTGQCEVVARECLLRPNKQQKVVTIPESHRLRR